MSKTILMCGGPAHGCWRVVEDGVWDIRVLVPAKLSFRDTDPEYAGQEVTYRVQVIPLFGHDLWLGIAVDEAYDNRSVMRAVLQRDVAQALGAY